MNKHIIIYTEGGFNLGLGNIYRSLSLANRIKEKNDFPITFITSSEEYVREIIIKHGFPVIYSSDKQENLEKIIFSKPSLVIIDYLGINISFVKKIKESNIKTVIIGNVSDANIYADIVVNAIIGTDFKNKKYIDKNGTLYLEGPKYLVLRREFTQKRNRYNHKGILRNITLLFGGTDQANLSCKVLDKLTDNNFSLNIKVILGAGYKFTFELFDIIERKSLKDNVHILQNINNVSEVLLDSDFLITSPGTAFFEAFCLGLPALSFFQNDSQQEIFRTFYRTERYEDIYSLTEYILELYNDIGSYQKTLDILSVGTGDDEIINEILNLLNL